MKLKLDVCICRYAVLAYEIYTACTNVSRTGRYTHRQLSIKARRLTDAAHFNQNTNRNLQITPALIVPLFLSYHAGNRLLFFRDIQRVAQYADGMDQPGNPVKKDNLINPRFIAQLKVGRYDQPVAVKRGASDLRCLPNLL